jgi:cell wall assembly regulator SMI1
MTSLTELIARADAALRAHRPDYYARLQPAATEQEIAAAEAYYGFQLPEPLRALYRWKNGQERTCYQSLNGEDNLSFMSLQEGVEAHRILNDLDLAGEFAPGWWDPAWVPFLANGGGDHVCMEVTPEGRDAGLIWFFHDDEARPMPDTPSVEQVLEVVVERAAG